MKTILRIFNVCLILILLSACSSDKADNLATFDLTAITPESGPVGTEIKITGTDFPANISSIRVDFGGAPAEINSLTNTQIITRVPEGAISGEVNVTVNGFTRTTPSVFTVLSDLESATVENLHAPQTGGQGQGEIGGPFTRFSFATGAVTESDSEWDIAFRGTTIAVNGGTVTGTNDEPLRNGNAGATIVSGLFSDVNFADGLNFSQDADGSFAIPAGSDNGWYNYNFMTNLVSPIPGKVLVFRTHDNKYAKVEILSYYLDAPANPDGFVDQSRYYTFRYVYNPNPGETSLAD